jgi:hypothetical protein
MADVGDRIAVASKGGAAAWCCDCGQRRHDHRAMGHGRRDEPHPRARRPQRGGQPTADSVRAHSSDNLGRDDRGQEGERGRLQEGCS